MLNYKSNGDIYFGPVRVYIGSIYQRPPRWLLALLVAAGMPTVLFIITLILGGFGRGY